MIIAFGFTSIPHLLKHSKWIYKDPRVKRRMTNLGKAVALSYGVVGILLFSVAIKTLIGWLI